MNYRLLLTCFIFLSCAASRTTETTLYFGQSKPDGGMVTEQEWNSFKENNISRVFKEGCSIIRIEGSWKDTTTNKLIAEPTYEVVYYYKNSPAISKQIDSLRYWYQKLYQQQSVLRVDRKVKASF